MRRTPKPRPAVFDRPIDSAPAPMRRRFMRAGAVGLAGVASLAAPAVSVAQPVITWRFQSTWPAKFLYQEFAVDWTQAVAELSGGRIKIDMLAAGAVVPGLQVIDAVNKGLLNGAHGLPGFWFGKNTAFGLYGAGPDFGMDADQLLGWIEYGGGRQLYVEIQKAINLDAESFLFGPVPCEPMGWFKKPIRSVADFKGLKFRTAGLAVDMFKELGMSTVQMAPADIVPAIDRGLLDGAEFASSSDDKIMGFPDVARYYLQQSYHMANNVCEVMINGRDYRALPEDLKIVLKHAARSASADMAWKAMHRMSQDFIELQALKKISISRTPKPILDAQLKAWTRVIERRSAENPLFAKVIESQRAWARRVIYWQNFVTVDPNAAYAHYFGKGPAV